MLFKVTPYDENDPESMFDDAMRMYNAGRYDARRYVNAWKRFFRVLQLKSDHRLALIYMAKSLIKSDMAHDAEMFYTDALELSCAQSK